MKITDNVKKILAVLSTVTAAVLAIYFLGRPLLRAALYIFSLLSPFIFGYALSRLINPVADRLQKRLKLPRTASVVLVIIAVLAIVGGLIGGVGYKLFDEIRNLISQWPEIVASVQSAWESFSSKWNRLYFDMPDSIQSAIDSASESLISQIETFTSDIKVVDNAQGFAKSLPGGLIWTIIFILSLFFMVSQKERIDKAVRRFFGEKLTAKIEEIKTECRVYLGGYFKAQAILMFVIFVLITMVLSIIGAPYALVVAAITAILDALPFLGSGITLLPLAVIYFISGNIKLGIGYVCVYVGVVLLRRLLEPKLVSDKMGFNPILTLVAMYIGYRWWGIIGMIIGPIVLMILFSVYKVGLFDRIIKVIKQLCGFTVKEIKLLAAYLDNITK
jgi:sporulation integral membrane protein YtvI